MFAEAVIPGILRAHGGSYPKARLRLEIEAGFAEAERGWYDELDEVDGSGGRRGCNAIARALAHLAHAGLIEPTRHCDEVRLKVAGWRLVPVACRPYRNAGSRG